MSKGLASDFMISTQNNALFSFLTGNSTLRLFQNNLVPAYNTPLASFVESTFAGYAARDIHADWNHAFSGAGIYECYSGLYTYSYVSGASQLVYGWYITPFPGFWVWAANFGAPVLLDVGASFTLRVHLQVGDCPMICT